MNIAFRAFQKTVVYNGLPSSIVAKSGEKLYARGLPHPVLLSARSAYTCPIQIGYVVTEWYVLPEKNQPN